MAARVLVIEDDPALMAILVRALEPQGFDVTTAGDAESGLEILREQPHDFVLLDLSLPGMDGLEACRRLRSFSNAYVIMLTGRDSEVDRLLGLEIGADDYMTKPFYASEVAARLRAMQRRPRAAVAGPSALRRFGSLVVEPGAREVRLDDQTIDLTRTEYQILDALSADPRVTLSRAQLLERVWGPNWFGEDHVIDVHVSNLRRKLGDDPQHPRYVRTVRGFGYRMGEG